MLMLSNAILKPRERQNEEWLKNNKKMPKLVSRAATVYRQQLKKISICFSTSLALIHLKQTIGFYAY